MKENDPVETTFGKLICKGHPIQELSPSVLEYRLSNSLAVTAYWNGSESFVSEFLSGEELLWYENMIREINPTLLNPNGTVKQFFSPTVICHIWIGLWRFGWRGT